MPDDLPDDPPVREYADILAEDMDTDTADFIDYIVQRGSDGLMIPIPGGDPVSYTSVADFSGLREIPDVVLP